MSRRNLDKFDGIGTWKRRPIRASKKTYMPSHKRWGKVITMPVPEGHITTSKIWTDEDVQLPEEPTEVEQRELTEEERLDIALKIYKGEL